MTNAECVEKVARGTYRLPKPYRCPDIVYDIMLRCWTRSPKGRLTFSEIYNELLLAFSTVLKGDLVVVDKSKLVTTSSSSEHAESQAGSYRDNYAHNNDYNHSDSETTCALVTAISVADSVRDGEQILTICSLYN